MKFQVSRDSKFVLGYNNLVVELDHEISHEDYAEYFNSLKAPPVPLNFCANKLKKVQIISDLDISKFLVFFDLKCEYVILRPEDTLDENLITIPLFDSENMSSPFNSPFLNLGESSDGLFIGPVITNSLEAANFHDSLNEWAYTETLKKLKFDLNQRPLSVAYYLEHFPEQLASTILTVIQDYPDFSYLFEKGSFKKLWSNVDLGKYSLQEMNTLLNWDRGFIRNVGEIKTFNDIYVSSKKIPILKTDYHESCSGKGSTPELAQFLGVTESLERYSAFLANNLPTHDSVKGRTVDLDKFPNKTISKVDYAYIEANNLKDDNRVFVPASLIPFPNINPHKKAIGSTSGLAFHITLDQALLSALDEILEKDNLYGGFLNLKTPIRIPSRLLEEALPGVKLSDFVFIHYKNELRLPIVHCFFQGQRFISRGSANSLNILDSIRKSYFESIQCSFNYENEDVNIQECSSGESYLNWKRPEVMNEIKTYLSCALTSELDVKFFENESEKLNYIKEKASSSIYYVTLPNVVKDGITVRVLVENALTIPEIKNAKFQHGIPT